MEAVRAGTAARSRSWPAVLAWTLFAVVLLVFACYPWLDHLTRAAGRPDLPCSNRSRSLRRWRR